MAHILHIESATEICSAALSCEGRCLAHHFEDLPNQHATLLTSLIHACLKEAKLSAADLAAVSVSLGPGSYTGLRVGLSTAKGICFGRGIPIIGISTLKALARASALPADPPDYLYCPMIDARRMEVYLALYDNRGTTLQEPGALILDSGSFDTYLEAGRQLVFCGNGAPKFQAITQSAGLHFREVRCSATHLIPLAWEAFQARQFSDLAYLSPDYIKAPNITKPRKRL